MRAKTINEIQNFNREGDPLKKMRVGKLEGFRIRYNKKPFIEIIVNLEKKKETDLYKKLNYRCHLLYEKDWEGINDSVYFFQEEIYYDWDSNNKKASLYLMNNIPIRLFDFGDEERTMWDYRKYPDLFQNMIVDPFLNGEYKTLLDRLVEDWFDEEKGFEDFISKWINEGNYKIHDIKYIGL
jgi:hypothetical protein